MDEPSIVGPTHILGPEKAQSVHEKQVDNDIIPSTDKVKNGTGPLYVKLAEGSAVDIDLFESRMARILDGESQGH